MPLCLTPPYSPYSPYGLFAQRFRPTNYPLRGCGGFKNDVGPLVVLSLREVANARATALLARAVQDQANVLAFIDGFMCVGFAVIGALLLMPLLRDPPARRSQLGG
jgi:hypothetical protein